VHSPRSFRSLALVALFAFAVPAAAQFYAGSQQEYGKNRVQYQEFLWSQYRFKDMEVFFYKEGRDLARYVAQVATACRRELEREFDFTIDDRLQFIVYNSLSDFRQSNIGLAGIEGDNNIGGMTRIVGTKIFVYFEGDHTLLDQQVRSGIAHVIIDQMMFGGNWREMVRSATFMSLPAWFTDGIISYHGHPWDATLNNRVRDGVLSGRYDKLHRLRGDDARMAGHAIWKYVADVYGPGVIPNILYMTRVSRNPESGFLFVLGVSLKTLTKECMAYYRSRFGDEDRVRQDMPVDPLPIRTKKRRQYGQFRQSPDGQHLAWVSNEMGQYKVWTYEIATGKVRRIAKGEKKLERIQDLSFPVIAWHPSGQALTYAVERKGQLYLRTYTLEDRKTTVKPVFMLKKILSMDYSPDGRNMVFSAVREGRTDLYYYYVIGNRQEQLTDDQYDDLHPRFSKDGRHIIFSSDRTSDTLRANADVALVNGAKDVFLFDLRTRSQKLTRLTSTPEVNETWPADRGDGTYVFLSDADGIVNRMLARRDSAISHIDTIVHYRYTTVVEPMTDLRRSILEQDVVPERRSFTQVQFVNGRYRFHQGRLDNGVRAQRPGEGEAAPVTLGPAGIGELRPVVKVDPQVPRPKGEDAVDPRNYVFLDENQPSPAAQHPTQPTVPHAVASAPGDTVAPAPFAYPEQRNYNINFTLDQVVTQVDNSFNNQFYQPFTGPSSLNPGLSALTRLGAMDLFEDYRLIGGVRFSLDLNNNDYLLAFENVKNRLDKRLTLQRQAYQGLTQNAVLKVHTHHVRYQVSWPFSELASVRGSVMYRNDRYVLQAIDPLSLIAPNVNDHLTGARLEYIYDSSLPLSLNLWTGWKLKVFGEYYQQPNAERSDMQVVGMDLRNAQRIHREMIWVNRLAGASSMGNRKIIHFLGGVDNWLFARVDNSIPIDFTQNYFYQTMAVPMRGFLFNARNGSSFAVYNSELRLPIVRYLADRPIRSDLFNHLQVVGFCDVGAAWTGTDPYSEDNTFNQVVIQRNPLTIRIDSQREPVLASYGFGLRTRLLGYFVRADWAWGIDDGVRQPRVFHFSLSLDI
jgi:hypothetical protein